jgi:endonuclease YncB( thermonuclease family)
MQLFTTQRYLSGLFLLAAFALPGSGEFRVAERVELERVVDGDTLAVRRAGKSVRLRLLCLDTEERFHPGQLASSGKPQTVFGEETALWAESFLEPRVRLGLCFPGGREQRDVYGRLLCHAVLPDGRDYELELVRAGRSPYFNKYGNSELAHAEFAAAQAEAQRRKLGIWNPATNQAQTPGTPSARRDYARLLPWWNARAEAVADFRRRRAAGEPGLVEAGDEAGLGRLAGQQVEVFGEPEGAPREAGGSLEVALAPHLGLIVPAGARAQLQSLGREYHQNYAYARGRLERSGKGFELRLERPADLRRAGPEPAEPR